METMTTENAVQHTPGPWVACGAEVYCADDAETQHEIIADCYNSTRTDDGEGNARLCAAAPELLDSLVNIEGAVHRLSEYSPDALAEWITRGLGVDNAEAEASAWAALFRRLESLRVDALCIIRKAEGRG